MVFFLALDFFALVLLEVFLLEDFFALVVFLLEDFLAEELSFLLDFEAELFLSELLFLLDVEDFELEDDFFALDDEDFFADAVVAPLLRDMLRRLFLISISPMPSTFARSSMDLKLPFLRR